MREDAGDEWYYNHEGETLGPVSSAELADRARRGGLDPQSALVWKAGMTDWLPAGEIEGLFERRTLPPPDLTQVAQVNPPLSPRQKKELGERDLKPVYPGAGRLSFYFMVLIFPVLWTLGLKFGMPFLIKQFGEVLMKQAMIYLPFVPYLFVFIIAVRRLIHVGMSGWWVIGNFLPLINLWVGYRSFVCPGGYAFSKKLDGLGVILAVIYWLFILAMIVVMAAGVAAYLGKIGSPEQQQQIQEMIRQATTAIQAATAPK